MFYLNTIKQLHLFVEQLDQLEVCLPFSRLLAGIQLLKVFQDLRWNSNETSLCRFFCFADNFKLGLVKSAEFALVHRNVSNKDTTY